MDLVLVALIVVVGLLTWCVGDSARRLRQTRQLLEVLSEEHSRALALLLLVAQRPEAVPADVVRATVANFLAQAQVEGTIVMQQPAERVH